MNNVYLVIYNWSNENISQIDMEDIRVFKKYEKAKECFDNIKNDIINMQTGYDEIEDESDLYCESENGEYLYYHELVKIEKKEVL